MAQTQTQIISNQWVPNSAASVYQSPSAASTKISQFVVSNTDMDNPQQIFIYLVNSGSPTLENLLEFKTLAAGESYMVYKAVNQTIPPLGEIYMSCPTLNVVNVQASGLVIT